MFSVSFTNWVLITVFVFYPFWVAKQVFSLKNRKFFLETENKGKSNYQTYPKKKNKKQQQQEVKFVTHQSRKAERLKPISIKSLPCHNSK